MLFNLQIVNIRHAVRSLSGGSNFTSVSMHFFAPPLPPPLISLQYLKSVVQNNFHLWVFAVTEVGVWSINTKRKPKQTDTKQSFFLTLLLFQTVSSKTILSFFAYKEKFQWQEQQGETTVSISDWGHFQWRPAALLLLRKTCWSQWSGFSWPGWGQSSYRPVEFLHHHQHHSLRGLTPKR